MRKASPKSSGQPIRVLLVEDDEGDVFLLRELLDDSPVRFAIENAGRLDAALTRLGAGGIDVVISDLTLPDSRGAGTFRALYAHPSHAPIIVLSGLDDEALALKTVEEGAQDYLVKGQVNQPLLVRSIRYAIKRAAAERALETERSLLRSVIDNIIDAVFVKDTAGRYMLGNAAHAERLGIALPTDVVGKTSYDFFPLEVARGFEQDDAEVIRSGGPIINRHEFIGGGEGHVQWLSTTKVPLRDVNGKIIGIVGIGRDITARKLAEEKLAKYTQELKVKNEEMEDDLNMAREVQQAFLPQQFPTFPRKAAPEESALRFHSRYLPTTTLAGDFFHVIQISDTQAGVFICDVMGHGVRAALVTAIQRALVEELVELAPRPGDFLTAMNTSLLSILRRTRSPMFISAFYFVADVATGELRYANAGHPRPLHLRRAAGCVDPLDGGGMRPGPALGVFDDTGYVTHSTRLAERDLVLLFTDGLYEVESPRGEFYDQARLEQAVGHHLQRSADQIFDETLIEVRRFSATNTFIDDVCLVAMDVHRLGVEAEAPAD